jgi:hypothetical protein
LFSQSNALEEVFSVGWKAFDELWTKKVQPDSQENRKTLATLCFKHVKRLFLVEKDVHAMRKRVLEDIAKPNFGIPALAVSELTNSVAAARSPQKAISVIMRPDYVPALPLAGTSSPALITSPIAATERVEIAAERSPRGQVDSIAPSTAPDRRMSIGGDREAAMHLAAAGGSAPMLGKKKTRETTKPNSSKESDKKKDKSGIVAAPKHKRITRSVTEVPTSPSSNER